MGAFRDIADIYRASKKQVDINWWTEYVCRPPAAVLVYALKDTRITPNQVTFLATAVAAGSAAMFIFLPGWWGAVAAALVFELSFVLDCVDGQLARTRKTASPLGHHLDFLMDEVKAYLMFGSITVRLWRFEPDPERALLYLLVGIGGLAMLGSGLAMTTFMRRREYAGSPAKGATKPLVIRLVEGAARLVVHYPSYLLVVAAIPPGRVDLYFWAYAGVNTLYAGRSFLQILLKLGRFRP